MAEESQGLLQFEFRDYFDVIRRGKWTVVGAIVIVVATGLFLSMREQKIYRAAAEVLVDLGDPNAPVTTKPDLLTEVKLLESAPVRALAAKALPGVGGVGGSPSGSKTMLIYVSDPVPQRALDSVNAYVAAYTDYRRQQEVTRLLNAAQDTQTKIDDLSHQVSELSTQLESQVAEVQNRYKPFAGETATQAAIRQQNLQREQTAVEAALKPKRDSLQSQQILLEANLRDLQVKSQRTAQQIQVINPAGLPNTPIRPKPLQDGIKALMLGVALGVLLAFAFDYFDDGIKTREDLQRALGPDIDVVGVVPNTGASQDPGTQLVAWSEPKSPAAEAYRTLRTALHFVRLEEPLATLAVTSPSLGEGKTTTLANLAVVIAQSGRRVVVLDCDLRRPRVHTLFGLSNEVGFTSVLIGEAPLSMALQAVPGLNHLSLLASGPIPPNPSELLASTRFRDVVELLKREHDVVLIDTPPLLPVTDAAVIVPSCDKVLLIVRAGNSTRKQVRGATELLQQVDANIAGVVLNGIEPGRRNGYYGYYYYAQTEQGPERRMSSSNGFADNGEYRSANGAGSNGAGSAPVRPTTRRRG